MKLAVAAVSLAVLGLLIGGCGGSSNNGGSSNTADYKACKAMIKADMAQSLSAVKSGRLPQNLPTAGAASCSHAAHTPRRRRLSIDEPSSAVVRLSP